jgi:hypothetical protein
LVSSSSISSSTFPYPRPSHLLLVCVPTYLNSKEARKAKLRENATSIKKSGQDKQTFKDR